MSDKSISSKNFFLISFLPAIAYWYLEENYSLHVALFGGLILACFEIFLEKIFTKHVHKISLFNFYLILVLGGLSLIGDDGVWFKLQPAFTGFFMGGYLFISSLRGHSLMFEMMASMNKKKTLPQNFLLYMEKRMGIFLFSYGAFMAIIANFNTTETWLFFKTIGFYILFLVYFFILLLYIKYVKRFKF